MTDTRLEGYATRIDRLEEERKAIGADVKDVYTEVKAAGYNTKALRKVLAQRRQKTDAQLEADIETYRAALGMGSYRAVAEQLGVSKSKLQRLVPRKRNGTAAHAPSPHDPETGEMTEVEFLGDDAGHRSEPSPPAEQSVNADPPPGSDGPSMKTAKGSNPASIAEATEDDLAIPSFLRRTKEAVT